MPTVASRQFVISSFLKYIWSFKKLFSKDQIEFSKGQIHRFILSKQDCLLRAHFHFFLYICNGTKNSKIMKKLIISLSFFLTTGIALAQQEITADSIPPISMDGVKDFGEFILDMGSMIAVPSAQLVSPQLTYQLYSKDYQPAKDYNELFRMNPNVTYGRGTYSLFSPIYSGFGFMPTTLQSATFRLKNGLRITTYGEYNADGYKVRNLNALPWERNNFNGAFEMKSENGNFGVRIEVHQSRHAPFVP